jgi:hypothetical protein
MKYNRIRELAKKAGFEEDMFGFGIWDSTDFQNFVELLVRECAWEVSEHYRPNYIFERRVSKILSDYLLTISKTEN